MPIAQAASRAHAAYQEIRRKILVGEFPPGMRLREVEVAEMLALGRTPVREALKRIQDEGLLRVNRREVEILDLPRLQRLAQPALRE